MEEDISPSTANIREAYLRYVDTAYWLRDPVLMEERRRLLERGEAIFADLLLERVLPYDAETDLEQLAESIGLQAETADLVGEALFGSFRRPGDAIRLPASPGRSTEEFLLARRLRWSQCGRDVGHRIGEDGVVLAASSLPESSTRRSTIRLILSPFPGGTRRMVRGTAYASLVCGHLRLERWCSTRRMRS